MDDTQRRLLATVPLFADLDAAGIDAVASVAEEIEVPAGTELTHEGRHEGYFYVVVQGAVEVDRGGAEVDRIDAGGFLGEISLIDDGPRTATAFTLTPCLLLRIGNRDFDALTETVPAIGDRVRATMEERLARIDDEAG